MSDTLSATIRARSWMRRSSISAWCPRADLLAEAARAHIGLSLMPFNSDDLNINHMAGASNKPFDYMAAGLALLVSDLPDWTRMFVEPGFGLACNPADVNSISAALRLVHRPSRGAPGHGRPCAEQD